MILIAGLIGDPVAHSVSPAFQQAAFDALGIAARYEAWQTPAAALPARVAALRAPGVLGANVTVPHKQAVMPLLDDLDPAARRAGAVNTIVNRDGRLIGFNTDIAGFITALREDGGLDPAGMTAAVLGAGGAGRAVVVALLDAGAARILVLNRTVDRAEALVRDLTDGSGRLAAGALPSRADHAAPLRAAGLLVHCTSIGMRHSRDEGALPIPAEAIPPDAFVADIVANPLVTPLLRAARERGCRTLGGLPMLVRQGAASFELWTGQPAPVDVMAAAATRAMMGRNAGD
jgi:shikimate dehydrogenase